MRTVLALVFTIAAATAFGQAPDSGDPLKKFDKNGDGKVTADELPNQQAFARFDKNQDGAITRDELGGAGKPAAGKAGGQFDALLKQADKDGDGKITKAEGGDAPWFAKLDQNQDDVIDANEIEKIRKAVGGVGTKPAAGSPGGQIDALLKQADKNGDGKITKAEAGNAAWFAKLDQNKDDVIDAAEIDMVRKAAGAGTKPAAGNKPAAGAQGGKFGSLLKQADKNGDGKVTKEEAGDAPWFDKVDQNKDGVLEADELEALRKAASKAGANS